MNRGLITIQMTKAMVDVVTRPAEIDHVGTLIYLRNTNSMFLTLTA